MIIVSQGLLNMRNRRVLALAELVGKGLTVGRAGGGRTI